MRCNHVARRPFAIPVLIALIVLPDPAFALQARRNEVSRSFDRTLTITGSPTLRVEHRHGSVRVRTHARNEVRIQATIRVSADSPAQAAAFADQVQIDVQQASDYVGVRTQYPELRNNSRNLSFSVDYDLLLPERMPIDVRNTFGAVSLTGVKGDATVVNAHGQLTASDGGGTYRLQNSFGTIDAARLDGDITLAGGNGDVSATTMSGSLTVTNRFGAVAFRDVGAVTVTSSNGDVKGTTVAGSAILNSKFGRVELRSVSRHATVDNSNGDILVQDLRGGATVSNRFGRVDADTIREGLRVTASNGDVRIADIDGATLLNTSFAGIQADRLQGSLTVDNHNGNVRASTVAGPATVTNRFGAVVLRDVGGRIEVRSDNGAIEAWPVAKPGMCHDVVLTGTFSPIYVHVPEAGYTVTARTAFGRIHADVPVTATGILGAEALSGTIGGGGCALQLTSRNGDIQILKDAVARVNNSDSGRRPARPPRPPRR